MVSFTIASSRFLVSPNSFADLTFPSFPYFANLIRGRKRQERLVSLNILAPKKSGGSLSGLFELKRENCGDPCWWCGGFVRRCKKGWDSEGDLALEAEILEFMKNSENPEVFPSKKQLVDAGRMDLVEAIVRQGGWLALGWDLDDDEEDEVQENSGGGGYWDSIMVRECDNGVLQQRAESNEVESSGVNSTPVNFFSSASSSGRSQETAAENDCGIEGILSRLEKERNTNFGFSLTGERNSNRIQSHCGKDDWLAGTLIHATVAGLKRSGRPASLSPRRDIISDSEVKVSQNRSLLGIDSVRNSLKPEMWRTWSIQRAGLSDKEFEAAEIASNEMGETLDVSRDEILEMREGVSEPLNKGKDLNSFHEEINHKQIRSRLQHLQLELSSVLFSLRSNTDEVSQKGHQNSCDTLQKLSDAWEFQENEIMNAQDKLRSLRAKLAVLEGKMALTVIDAQKMVEEKQKRIDDARRALRLLRMARVVWPNSASEVLLTGSFDGWATQRKMEKSSTGVFSLCLKLYPGKYEIKFIVDGEWRIDPLRPIVHYNGYENNLLIIS